MSSSKKIPLKDGSIKRKTKPQEKKVDKLEELEKLRNSEKMMDAFLASTAPHNKETNKNERTKTIIKTIRVSRVQRSKFNNIFSVNLQLVLVKKLAIAKSMLFFEILMVRMMITDGRLID